MIGLHPAARDGFAAGAATYAGGRPDYPAAIDGWLRDALGLGPGRTALDLGAGTGKFTARLVATGARVVAVEPVAEMRARLAEAAPDAEAREGVAEALPVPDESQDALVCAQAFHWFATPAALAEIRRALRIGGRLGLVWNVRDESFPWVAELTALLAPYEGETPRYGGGKWREIFPAPGFSALQERTFPHRHDGPAERVVIDRLLSTSFVAALDAERRAEIAAAARRVLVAHGIGDVASFPYVTHAFFCARLS